MITAFDIIRRYWCALLHGSSPHTDFCCRLALLALADTAGRGANASPRSSSASGLDPA